MSKQLKKEQPVISVETIPAAFYGGKNPVIFEKNQQQNKPDPKKNISSHKKKEEPKPIGIPIRTSLPVQTQKPLAQNKTQFDQPSKTKKTGFIILGVILFLLAIGAISYYYIYLASPKVSQTPALVVPPSDSLIVDQEDVQDVLQEIATTTEQAVETEVVQQTKLLEIIFPTTLVSFAVDLDQDGLSDKEESVFQTDPSIKDTDQDGYDDFEEIKNLYNPSGFAPVKIIDSGLVKEYQNSTWKYRLYYPISWQPGQVDPEGDQVLFSTVDQQFVEVVAVPKNADETFFTWFGRKANSQNITDLVKQQNRFDQEVYMRKDALVMYVDTPEVVYVLLYRNDSNDPIDYKNVLLLMTQSFRVNKSIVVQSTTISQTTSTQNTSIIQNSSSTTSTINQEF